MDDVKRYVKPWNYNDALILERCSAVQSLADFYFTDVSLDDRRNGNTHRVLMWLLDIFNTGIDQSDIIRLYRVYRKGTLVWQENQVTEVVWFYG